MKFWFDCILYIFQLNLQRTVLIWQYIRCMIIIIGLVQIYWSNCKEIREVLFNVIINIIRMFFIEFAVDNADFS